MLTSLLIAVAASLTAGLSVYLLLSAARHSAHIPFNRLVNALNSRNAAFLQPLDRPDLTASTLTRWTLLTCAGVAGATALLAGSLPFAVIAGASAGVLPRAYLLSQRRRHVARFNEQLPVGLEMLASSARAGLSLQQCVEEVARSGPAPLRDEFERIRRDVQLGSPVASSLLQAKERLGSIPFGLVTTALLVSINRGGNLAEALSTLSDSLKEIWRLEQKLVTASAEGRKAMMVISAVPVFVAVLVMITQPQMIRTLTSSLIGFLLLGVAAGFYVAGLAWARRMLGTSV